MDIATSTKILLLSQKVDSLQNYFGWVIGGVTITITVLIALFLGIQFFSYKKMLERKSENMTEKFNVMFNKQKKKVEKLADEVEENHLHSLYHARINSARTARESGDYKHAFLETVWAAFFKAKGGSDNRQDKVARLLASGLHYLSDHLDSDVNFSNNEINTLNNQLSFLRDYAPQMVHEIEQEIDLSETDISNGD